MYFVMLFLTTVVRFRWLQGLVKTERNYSINILMVKDQQVHLWE